MATNTLDTVHPSDSDDSDYQYEVQNLAQQAIHFTDYNNVPSSDNESLNNIHLTMSLWTVKWPKW